MKKIRILTDSSSDINIEEAKELGVDIIPLKLSFGENEYLDGITITKDEFYHKLIDEHLYPKTSQATVKEFITYFKEAKANEDEVIVLLISQALSGTMNSAFLAKQEVDYDHIHIIDTKTTIGGLRHLVVEAIKQIKANKKIEEVVNVIESLIPRIEILATINTLEYLKKGGRLSGIEAMIGTLVNLKPIITFDKEGKIKVIQKAIGKVKANRQMLNYLNDNPIDENYPVYYYYSFVEENLTKFKENLKQTGKFVEGINVNLSPVVGCHIGDNAYGLVYIRKQ